MLTKLITISDDHFQIPYFRLRISGSRAYYGKLMPMHSCKDSNEASNGGHNYYLSGSISLSSCAHSGDTVMAVGISLPLPGAQEICTHP
jgi:hypothetical protein